MPHLTQYTYLEEHQFHILKRLITQQEDLQLIMQYDSHSSFQIGGTPSPFIIMIIYINSTQITIIFKKITS